MGYLSVQTISRYTHLFDNYTIITVTIIMIMIHDHHDHHDHCSASRLSNMVLPCCTPVPGQPDWLDPECCRLDGISLTWIPKSSNFCWSGDETIPLLDIFPWSILVSCQLWLVVYGRKKTWLPGTTRVRMMRCHDLRCNGGSSLIYTNVF